MIRSSLLQAEVEVPDVVVVPAGRKTVRLDVRCTVTNASEHDYVLHRRAGEAAHFVHVLDENHREVARLAPKKKAKAGPAAVRTHTIAAGHGSHDVVRLAIDASKLQDGKIYRVRAEHWGQVAETSFMAIVSPAAGAAKRKPAKKAKKARTATKAKKTRGKARKATRKPTRKIAGKARRK